MGSSIVILAQGLVLASVLVGGWLLARALRLDASLGCLLAGFLFGLALPWLNFDTGIRAHNLQDLVFFYMLPILVLEATWLMDSDLLNRLLAPILLLAIPGALLAAALTAVALFFGIGHPGGFPWSAAWLCAAILAATDPTLVIGALRRLGAPEDLTVLLEGESLFNDATGFVLFALVVLIAQGEVPPGPVTIGLDLLRVLCGGLALGLFMGSLAAVLALALLSTARIQALLLLLALITFYGAERLLEVSGIVAVMAMAMSCRAMLAASHADKVVRLETAWSWLGTVLGGLLFVILGLVIGIDMFRERWLAIAIAVPAVLLTRLLMVCLVAGASRVWAHSIPWRWQLILSWGALRGPIAIALALSLPTSLPWWWTVQSIVFGVAIFSLLVQGTSCRRLILALDAKAGKLELARGVEPPTG